MRINYNITGPKRKSLVAAISQELNAPTHYLGPPTFAYGVGGYHIDKNGVVTGPDNLDFEADLQDRHGFEAIEREYDERDIYESGRSGMLASDIPQPDETDQLTIEMPLSFFTEEGFANLEKLIASKADLIKKALGVDALPIEQTETTLKFPWFRFPAGSDEVAAYSRFIGALCAAAKRQKRVTAHEKTVDNEKYAFRCFLLRLGFIGDEYKQVRKILLRNLTGNSAFKSGNKKGAEVCDEVSE
ncbi:MAG: virulence protein [Firmicutes bacterium HGW-Firmicutes-11]|nr:MAG: virulence protein [Firmicutes bacterium HGW-Firmicutes-11]